MFCERDTILTAELPHNRCKHWSLDPACPVQRYSLRRIKNQQSLDQKSSSASRCLFEHTIPFRTIRQGAFLTLQLKSGVCQRPRFWFRCSHRRSPCIDHGLPDSGTDNPKVVQEVISQEGRATSGHNVQVSFGTNLM